MICIPAGVSEKEFPIYVALLEAVDVLNASRRSLAAQVERRTAEINVIVAAEALAKLFRFTPWWVPPSHGRGST